LSFQAIDHPLKRARQAAGFSLRGLAKPTRIHYSRLCLFEHGLRPREDELLRLAGVLRCAPEDLQPRQAVAS
jgi:hypothetical protein